MARSRCESALYGLAMATNRELIDAALDCLHPLRRDDGVKLGNVSAAVASTSGRPSPKPTPTPVALCAVSPGVDDDERDEDKRVR
jgi:hypothetical protein